MLSSKYRKPLPFTVVWNDLLLPSQTSPNFQSIEIVPKTVCLLSVNMHHPFST